MITSDAILAGLNPVQREAASAPDGPIVVIAGAGSGKTRVLTHRIAFLIAEQRASPFGLAAITFTNKAAGEMKARVGELVGPVAERMWVSTFHSMCSRILRREAPVLGYRSSFSIYDQADAVRLVDYVRRDLDMDPKRFPPRRLQAAISAMKNELVSWEQAVDRAFTPPEKRVADVYREYQRRLLEASALDFDDLLVQTVHLFRDHADAKQRWSSRFRHVLVDEFQDTNVAQWELVRMLTEEHRNVMVVGDQDQCLVEGTRITMGDGTDACDRRRARRRPRDVVLRQRRLPSGEGAAHASRGRRARRRHHALRPVAASSPPKTTSTSRVRCSESDEVHRHRELSVVLCDELVGATPMHRVSFPDVATRRAALPRCASSPTSCVRISSDLDVPVHPVARLGERPLPFLPASSVRRGMVMVDEHGQFDVVTDVEGVDLELPVYDLDVERTHNFVAEGLVTHNSIYKFRGADFRNLTKFEETFPEASIILMEQNYRSSQRILDAANAVIANNAARRPKHLWTEQIGGELITRYHAEDEHDEAAFVVHEIGRLVDTEHHRFGDVAVFYRTNAQSRVVEESLVRAGVPYRVVGGVKFYDRREVKDVLAYLRALVNPDDEVSWRRVVNTPKRGRRRHVGQQGGRARAGRGHHVPRGAVARRLRRGDRQGARGHPRPARADGGVRSHRGRWDRADGRGDPRADRLPRRARGRAVDRGARSHREPAGAGGRVPRVRPGPRRRRRLRAARHRGRGHRRQHRR